MALYSGDPYGSSQQLLMDILPLHHRYHFAVYGNIKVQSKLYRSRTYVIAPLQRTAIYKNNKESGTICLQIHSIWTPCYDKMIAEYLLLTNDEEQYLRTGNISGSVQTPLNKRRLLNAILIGFLIIMGVKGIIELAYLVVPHLK